MLSFSFQAQNINISKRLGDLTGHKNPRDFYNPREQSVQKAEVKDPIV